MSKKYYWLKLDRNFFKRHDIRIIEDMPNGKEYVLFFMKLLLESIDHEGSLRFNELIPYNDQMLATITNTNIDIVRSAIKVFQSLNLLQIWDDQTIFVSETQKMLGESKSTQRVNRFREKQKREFLGNSYGKPCVYCGNESTDLEHIIPRIKGGTDEQVNLVPACKLCNGKKYQKDVADFLNDERESINVELVLSNEKIMNVVNFNGDKFTMKRYRNVTETENETEIEKEIEIELDIDKDIKPKKNVYGEFNNVKLTDDEYKKLEEKGLLSEIEKLSSYIESKGVRYKSHYATILVWNSKNKGSVKDKVVDIPTYYTQKDDEEDKDELLRKLKEM